MAGLHFDATYNNADVMRKVRESQKAFAELANTAEVQGKRIDAAFEKISLKSLERVQEIMKGFPKEVQGISSFKKQLDELEKHAAQVSQRITSAGSGKLTPTLNDTSSNINIGNVLRQQVFEGSQAINTLTEKIIQQKTLIKDVEHDVRTLGEAYKRAGAGTTKGNALFADFKSAKAALQEEKNALFELQTQQAQARLSVRKLKDEQSLYQKETQNVVNANEKMSLSFGKTLAAIGGTAMLKKFISDVVHVRGMFQQLEIAFETMLKSKEKASALMAQLTETAAKTPFDLQSVSQGAKQLLAYGTASEEVNDTLIRLGNIASGLSIPLGDLVYLYGTTQTQGRLFTQDVRQFMGRGIPLVKELAVELGKTEQEINEMVTAGKIGFPEVEKVIRNMTNEGGQFYNLMERQSASLTGQISNLGDAWDSMLNEIGTQTQGAASIGISALSSLIENYKEVGVVLASVIASYGTYRAAIIIINTLEKANIMLLRQAIIEKKLAAAANITLSNSMAIAAARGKMFALVQRNIVSSFKGIGRTLTNPYVLFGAAVGAVTYGLYKFYTRETEVEQMQKQYNETKKTAARREEEHKTKIDELISSIENEITAEMDRVGAMETLKKLYPDIIEKYINEEGRLRNIIALKKELAEFEAGKKIEQNKTELQSYDERIKNQEEYIDSMRTNDQSAFDDEVAKLNELKRQRELSRANVAADYINKAINEAKSMSDTDITNLINTYQKALADNKNGEWFNTDKEFKVDEINRYISALKNLQTTRANAVHDKEHWTNQKKEAETAIDAIDSKQRKLLNAGKFDKVDSKVVANYKEQKRLIAEAEKELKVYDSSSAGTLRKEQEKRNEELLTLQRNNQKSEIDLMEEGSKKKIAQIELDYKNEIAAIKKQEEEWSKAQGGKLTEKQSQEISIAYTQAEDKKDKGVSDVKKETQKEESERLKTSQSAWNEYYQTYGTWEQKRLALAKEYQQKIKEVQNDKNKSGDEKNALIATLQKEWDEALANLDLSKLKEDINWGMIFGDLTKVTKDQLNKIKKQLQEFKKSPEFQNATPEQIQVIETAINSINDALVDKGGFFGGLANSLTEYEGTVYKVKEAQEELEKALKSGDEAAIEKAKKKKSAAEQNQANAQTNVEKSKDKAISNITAVANAMTQLGSAEFSLSSFGSAVGGLVDALSESGSKIGGIIAAILSLLDEFGKDGGVEFGKNIVNNVISAIGGTIEVPFKMLGIDLGLGGANYTEYNEMVAKYDTLLDVWDQLLDKKKAYIKESYGIEATKVGQEALDLLNSERKITRELASSRLDAGASAGSHSMSYRMWKGSYDYEGTNWKDVAGDISKSLGGVDFSSMWSMLDMSSEQLEWIKINYSGLWASMDGDFRGYLDDIIQYGDTEKEILKSINEQLTQTSFDSLFDSFLNTLMDMDASSKDFADSFEEYMRKAIFTSMFAKNYEDELTKWYEAFAEANKKEEGITEDDVKNLRNRWDNIVNGALSDREAWEKIVGSSGSESSREASKKGLATASQDSVDELNGRFTVIQGHTYEINSSVKVIQSDTAKIAEKLSFLTSMDKNMSDMVRGHDIIVAHLSNIEGYTANLVDIRQFMYFMKLGIDSLNTKGITLKR